MAHINFIIPSNKEELLSENDDFYFVKEVYGPKELISQMKNAKVALMDEGAEFILDKFDVYYSVLSHSDKLAMDVIFQAYTDLHRALGELNRALGFLLEDPESLNDEVKNKFLTIIKMLVYIYTQIIFLLGQKNHANDQNNFKGKGRKGSVSDTKFDVNKKSVILALHNLMERDIFLFWDPPVLEENFIKLISEVCYAFLQYPSIKSEKEVRNEIFNLFGNLIKKHNYGTTFVIRSVQSVKLHEHLVLCLSEGIKILVEEFSCKGLVHDFIREVTEWQVDDRYSDGMGAKNCANILVELSASMPTLMLPELLYLNRYLAHESAVLRNCILSVMTEIILNVLTKRELSEENKQYRDDFLTILIDHIEDVASSVRAKVFQHFYRLQKENAIPIKNQNTVLEAAVLHLRDKYCSVRKWAIQCVTAFLSHNIFSANLSLKSLQSELEGKKEMLNNIQSKYITFKEAKIAELEQIWNEKLNSLKDVIEEELNKEESDEEEDDEQEGEKNEVPYDEIVGCIREKIMENKFKEALSTFKKGIDVVEEFEEEASGKNAKEKLELYLNTIKLLFINVEAIDAELKLSLQAGNKMSEQDLKQMEELEANVEFLKNCVQYLSYIDQAIEPMIQLLETTSIGDMHEAINFFITAYQFNIDNANAGILAMLRIMQRNEQDRKDAIIKAFRTIYLVTDGKSMLEHTSTIVNRLIGLVKSVSINSIDDLESIIAEWTNKGVLDNSVIDMLWQFFLKNHECSDDDSRAALEILRMAAMGRRTIITKNIKVVSTVAFGERGQKSMLLVGSACKFLQIAGMEKIDTTSDKVLFKIKHHDTVFSNLLEILINNFLEPIPFYNKALIGGVQFIYKLSNKPDLLCEKMLLSIWEKYQQVYGNSAEIPSFIATRWCQLAGIVAINQLDYLDDAVYKELKRRSNIREQRQKGKSGKVKKKVRANKNNSNADDPSLNATLEESTLEGAVAEDQDAELILDILDNHTVSGLSCLAKFALSTICEQPNIYDVKELQGAAVISLMRYMLVSNKECASKVQLLFTIFEKTTFSNVKCSILVHLSDLLTRFPNIVEPWTPKIYQRLKDHSIEIRRATFFTLSSLILRDMIRAHKYISDMAICLVDDDKQLVAMCKTFFMQLAHKENNLYNVLPDVFSHLMESETLTEENVQYIMKYLFDLIDKTKHMENLLERFCYKFKLADTEKIQRNISYCLTLITYNDRCLRKLQENFAIYKHLLHIGEVYNHFQTILTACSKPQVGKVDLKPICTEIQDMIKSVFELNEDGQMMKPPPTVPKLKRTKKQPVKRKARRRDDDSDSDEDISETSRSDNSMMNSSNRSTRTKRTNNK